MTFLGLVLQMCFSAKIIHPPQKKEMYTYNNVQTDLGVF